MLKNISPVTLAVLAAAGVAIYYVLSSQKQETAPAPQQPPPPLPPCPSGQRRNSLGVCYDPVALAEFQRMEREHREAVRENIDIPEGGSRLSVLRSRGARFGHPGPGGTTGGEEEPQEE